MDCGYREHPAALDFDHRDPTAKRMSSIAKHLTRRWEVVLAEIAKCDVVCANCHRIRTAKLITETMTGRPHTGQWRDRPVASLRP